MGGYENYRRSIVIRGESVLQFKATHPRQAEIENQTIRTAIWIRLQELFRRRKGL